MREADDGLACCYVLVEGRSAAEVAALLGGHLRGPRRSERDAAQSSAAWPAAGAAGEGWTVLVDPHFEFGDAHDEMREWSRGTRVVCVQVIERECFSHAVVWADGKLVWEVSFEGKLDDRPLVGGQFPLDLDALACLLGPTDDPRTWYRLPAAAVEQLTNWQPGRPDPAAKPSFAEVVYLRPAGVAASVARDLADQRRDAGPE